MSNKIRKAYADTATGQVHYRTGGEGTPLLLIHQTAQSSLQYANAMPLLIEQGIRVVATDTPGFGMSDTPPGNPTIESYSEVFPQVLDQLGIDRTVVLGHHTGASIACQLAYAHPERVSRVLLHGPPCYTDSEREERLARPHRDRSPQEDGSHLLDRWKTSYQLSAGVASLDACQMSVIHGFWAGNNDHYGHHAAYSYDMPARIAELSQPVMLISNTGDAIHHIAVRLKEQHPHFSLKVLEGGSAFHIWDDPEPWAAAIVDFVTATN